MPNRYVYWNPLRSPGMILSLQSCRKRRVIPTSGRCQRGWGWHGECLSSSRGTQGERAQVEVGETNGQAPESWNPEEGTVWQGALKLFSSDPTSWCSCHSLLLSNLLLTSTIWKYWGDVISTVRLQRLWLLSCYQTLSLTGCDEASCT